MSDNRYLDQYKKNLSGGNQLDRMKDAMLKELEAHGWYSKVDSQIQQTLEAHPENVGYKDLVLAMYNKDKESYSSNEEMNWEMLTRQLVDTMSIPDDLKTKIFKEWTDILKSK